MYPDWQSIVQNNQMRKLIECPWSFDDVAKDTHTVQSIQAYTSSVDDHVASLERSISRLTSQRDLFAFVSRSLNTFFSPINSLPTEVLVNIFGLCASANAYARPKRARIQQTGTAFILSQVCRRWRSIVNDSPLLWSYFRGDWPVFHTEKEPFTLVDAALERTRQVPLHVRLDFYNWGVHSRMKQLLKESSHRWRRLDISQSTSHIQENIEELGIIGGLPLLEELHLKLRCTQKRDNIDVLEFTADCPKLTRLFLQAELGHPDEFDDEDDSDEDENEDEVFWTLPQDHRIPWHQLTMLVWGLNSSEKEMLDVLYETKQLETLEILPRSITLSEESDPPVLWDYMEDPVTLQHLTSLRYEEGYGIIDGLCCPVLERLHMSDIDEEALSGFLARSDPPLKTLRTDTFHRDWVSINSDLMPHLEEFIIGDSVHDLLAIINDQSVFEIAGPPTKVFTIDTPTAIENIWDDETWAIEHLVRSIWSHEGLEALNIFTRERDTGDMMSFQLADRSKEVVNKGPLLRRMNVLRNEGLKVTVSYSPSIYPDNISSRDYY